MFDDRADAGRRLAIALADYANRDDAIVLGLPRGGVAVAYEVATHLGLPLDVCVVRKLGAPSRPELAMGALAGDGTVVLDDGIAASLAVSGDQIAAVLQRERRELQRREREYRGLTGRGSIDGKVALLVDDGVATGATMRVAALSMRRSNPSEVVVAVPVGDRRACESLLDVAERVVCLYQPEPLRAVGGFYRDFRQTTDEEVRRLLVNCTA
jgi:putative phosphoribosyl transferase